MPRWYGCSVAIDKALAQLSAPSKSEIDRSTKSRDTRKCCLVVSRSKLLVAAFGNIESFDRSKNRHAQVLATSAAHWADAASTSQIPTNGGNGAFSSHKCVRG